jgi:hypothetical protein
MFQCIALISFFFFKAFLVSILCSASVSMLTVYLTMDIKNLDFDFLFL